MKLAILVLLNLILGFATEYNTDNGVLLLTESTFSSALKEFDYLYCHFQGPKIEWPGFIGASFHLMGRMLPKLAPNLHFAEIDCSVEKIICSMYDIGDENMHEFIFFVKGKSVPLPGYGLDISSWLRKQVGPTSIYLHSIEEAEKHITQGEVFVLFFGSVESNTFTSFLAAAETFDNVFFGHTDKEGLRERYDVQGETLILFRKTDEGKVMFSASNSVNEIVDFISSNNDPRVYPYSHKATDFIYNSGIGTIFLGIDDIETSSSILVIFKSLAEDFKGKLNFVFTDTHIGQYFLEERGISSSQFPAILAIQKNNNSELKFVYDKEITIDNLRSFIQDFLDNKLTPYLRSESIPDEPFEGDFRVVVGKNFNEVVLNSDDDVLIVFYFEQFLGALKYSVPPIAQQFKDVPGLVIAKMDFAKNDVPDASRDELLWMKFYPKGRKDSPIEVNSKNIPQQV